MKHRICCSCHDTPRVCEPWMLSFWFGMQDVAGFTVKNQPIGGVLVHCGPAPWEHAHPYRDPECVKTEEQMDMFA